jgi:elongation factor Ts
MMGGDEPSRFSSFHSSRNEPQGIIATYIHPGGRVGALVELSCDTDFVARTEEFRTLGREIAMQVAAMDPSTVGSMDSPADDPGALLDQEYIRDSSKTIRDLVNETIAKVREHIWVTRFVRFEVGER